MAWPAAVLPEKSWDLPLVPEDWEDDNCRVILKERGKKKSWSDAAEPGRKRCRPGGRERGKLSI